MDPVVIQGDRVRLIPPPDIGFARITGEWVNDPLTRHLIGGSAYQMSLATREDFVRERLTQSFSGLYLMIEVVDLPEQQVVGAIELRKTSPEHRSGEVGILVGREYWGRGYGTDAMRALCRFAFEEMDLRRISLEVMEFNTRAIRSYERIGFVVEGRFREDTYLHGHYYDTLAMGLLREEFEAAEAGRGQG
jgi:RimJ/RimL family protein N-acetyltransferase